MPGDSRSSSLTRQRVDFEGSRGGAPAAATNRAGRRHAAPNSCESPASDSSGRGSRWPTCPPSLAEWTTTVVSVMDGRRVTGSISEVEVERAHDARTGSPRGGGQAPAGGWSGTIRSGAQGSCGPSVPRIRRLQMGHATRRHRVRERKKMVPASEGVGVCPALSPPTRACGLDEEPERVHTQPEWRRRRIRSDLRNLKEPGQFIPLPTRSAARACDGSWWLDLAVGRVRDAE